MMPDDRGGRVPRRTAVEADVSRETPATETTEVGRAEKGRAPLQAHIH